MLRVPSTQIKLDLLQGTALRHRERRFSKASYAVSDAMTLDVDDADRGRLAALGVQVYDTVQFEVFPSRGGDDDYRHWSGSVPDEDVQGMTLTDVVDQVRAPNIWGRTRGRGVTIAVIDTGVADGLREIQPERRSSLDIKSLYAGRHWTDTVGHGSMCAAIAAGSKVGGGRYDGIAPDAMVLAARSSLDSTDVFDIYDELVRMKVEGGLKTPLVVTNSYGLYTCSTPAVLPLDHPFMSAILTALERDIFVCFAAGNNHVHECSHDPAACGPNTIWGPNSHDRVVSVGTVNRSLTNQDPATHHVNSSRGPGEWAQKHLKPDCVAPTYGEVPWGSSYAKMGWWGTSGACPQVAGLAALILSVVPSLRPDKVADIIRATCIPLRGGSNCVGKGVIDCESAVALAIETAQNSDAVM